MMFRKAIKDKPDKINLIKAGWVKLKVFIDKFQRSGHSLLLLSLSLPRHMTGFTSAFDARQCDRTPPTVTLYGAPQVGRNQPVQQLWTLLLQYILFWHIWIYIFLPLRHFVLGCYAMWTGICQKTNQCESAVVKQCWF